MAVTGLVLLLGLVVLVAAAVAAVVLLVVLLRGRGGGTDRLRAVGEARARRVLRAAGLVVGLLGAWAVAATDQLGRGLLLAAPVAALGLLLGVLGAELAVRPPTGPRRQASLVTRRTADHLPRPLSAWVTATGVSLLVLGVLTTAVGSTDDMGRVGRSLSWTCSASTSAGHGPWPGWFYTGPLLLVVGLGLALAALVLRATVARPPVGGRSAAAPGTPDDVLRHRAATSVVAGTGVLLAVPLAGMALVAAAAVQSLVGCAPQWWSVVAAGLLLLGLLALAVLLWCVSALLVGGRTAPRSPGPTVPDDLVDRQP